MKEGIGSQMYPFTRGGGRYSNHCVISSHGGYKVGCCGGSTFTVPRGVDLYFYSGHGDVVRDFGLNNSLSNVWRVAETLDEGDRCRAIVT